MERKDLNFRQRLILSVLVDTFTGKYKDLSAVASAYSISRQSIYNWAKACGIKMEEYRKLKDRKPFQNSGWDNIAEVLHKELTERGYEKIINN